LYLILVTLKKIMTIVTTFHLINISHWYFWLFELFIFFKILFI